MNRVVRVSHTTDQDVQPRWYWHDHSIMLVCPNGHIGLLHTRQPLSGHMVLADGTVHPSVECPNTECPWHEFVCLDDYEAGAGGHGP